MNSKRLSRITLRAAVVFTLYFPLGAWAHFQELIPSTAIVTSPDDSRIQFDIRFTHPMARGPVMAMGEPAQFGVVGPAGREDIKARLKPGEVDGKRTYSADYRIKQPGSYVFFIEPAPYWEPAEETLIIHYAKVVVGAFGAEEDWDADVGLPVEITPLTRPYGLWTGNLFQGIVKQGGQPVLFAEVEVEWRNDGSVTPPSDPFITQVIKADGNGVFSYAMPRAGWWGFAALLESQTPMQNPEGKEVAAELGALIWVQARDMK